jgi:alpha-mannosidase
MQWARRGVTIRDLSKWQMLACIGRLESLESGKPGMKSTLLASALLMAALTQERLCAADAAPVPPGEQILYYVPHTHWEGAVFKTREEYLDMGLRNILQAVHLLKSFPNYKFTLDQVAYIKPFLERYPEEEGAFRQFIAEGRLGIVGGMDVMPDDVKPGGELFIRQVQYGKAYCRERLGVDVTVGWFLDTFGHHPQLPQLLKLAGYKSFWFCRGVSNNQMVSEFRWRGIDGTEIPAFWLPGFYGLFYGPPREFPRFADFFRSRFESLSSHATGPERVGLAGADVSEPEEYVPSLVDRFNRQADTPFTIRYSIPTEFEAVVARRPNPAVISADLNPIFQGTYSSRIELKQLTRAIEQRLLTAEKLGVLAGLQGTRFDEAMLWRAWEPVLFNQTHDLASGVMTDHVYDDTVASYAFSTRLADEMKQKAWDVFAARIDTRGSGIPVIVFNPLGWSRTDAAEVEVGFATGGGRSVRVLDSDGRTVPVQLLSADRYDSGGLRGARLAFIASNVPSLGYSVFHVMADDSDSEETTSNTAQSISTIENEFFRVTVDPAGGQLTSVVDKSSGREALARPANVISRQEDRGDLWELYRGLDGGSYIAMTNQQAVPTAEEALLSSDARGTKGTLRTGPVFSEVATGHPLGNGSFATRVRLYAGVRRIDIETRLVNNEKWVRYQALFPTTISQGQYVQEIPFGAVERPRGIEFPAQNWVDFGDGQRGVALLNCGLPGNLVSDGTLLLSLMRSENIGGYGFGGGYEPGMGSDTGFELGRPLTFHYALVPHEGTWQEAQVYRAGLEMNQPLVVRKAAPHPGELPHRLSFVEISEGNVVLSSVTPARDGAVVVRVSEAAGKPTSAVKVRLRAPVHSAWVVNLMQDPEEQLKIEEGSVHLDLHPFEIKTVKFGL